MKLNVVILLYFDSPKHILCGEVEVRGTLESEVQPAKGSQIYLPYFDSEIGYGDDQDVSLYVRDSNSQTVAVGKIEPRIILERRSGPDDSEKSIITDTDIWKMTHRAISRFLNSPTVRWGEEYVFDPWPSRPEDLPAVLWNSLKD